MINGPEHVIKLLIIKKTLGGYYEITKGYGKIEKF